jgi:dienelactone hydrolase
MKLLPALVVLFSATTLLAQSPSEVKPIPPPGVEIPADVRAELSAGAEGLAKEIASLRVQLEAKPELLALLPDVEIFHKAVDWALRYNEFFDLKQPEAARKQLALGMDRAKALREGKAPWNEQTGLVVRGYRSKIDGSVQPYGLVIPESWKPTNGTASRLDFWLHGRGEKLSELSFLEDRMKNKGEFTPENTIVLHLYGRYCNANKFAGEVDLFEALENARKHYPIDSNRMVVRGFSMGGASTWQFGTHFAGMWAAVAPGAGFAETAEFFKVFADGKTPPPWYEQMLWRWYDATLYSANLANTTTVAYSGEIDGQKQAADIMIRFAEKEGITFPHIIGPQTAHKYHPESKPKIEEIVSKAAAEGRDPFPKKVRFTTYTLLYPRMEWITVTGMQKEWERADVLAEVKGTTLEIKTSNVTGLQLDTPSATSTGSDLIKEVVIDGVKLPAVWTKAGLRFSKTGGNWSSGPEERTGALKKQIGLCGPVDHAFMSRFVMVRPTGKAMNEIVGNWTKSEMDHSVDFWRKTFRGDAPVIDDKALSDDQIKNANLILWGDPSSNAVLAKILPKLPIQWSASGLTIGKQKYDAANTAPILIFPNPLNPEKYVVINSGVTFREQALLNNSDQTPKLPDWAVVDLRTPADAKWPGLVLDAGFFNEQWQMQ